MPFGDPEHLMDGSLIIEWRIGREKLLYYGGPPNLPRRIVAHGQEWQIKSELLGIHKKTVLRINEQAINVPMGRVIDKVFTVNSAEPTTWIPEYGYTLGQLLSRIGYRPDMLTRRFAFGSY